MTVSLRALLLRLLLCAAFAVSAAAQTQPPAKRHPVPPIPPRKPPVVQPHGPAHPHPPPQPAAQSPAPPPPEPPKDQADSAKGSSSGLPLPRFVALRFDDVNMRAGPGTRYPIEWQYKRRDLPVEILREFEVWRLVQDPEGIKGWVHQATLTGRRSFIVIGADATLHRQPQDTASAVAILKVGVIGQLRACPAGSDWCQVQTGDYRGYLKRSQIWGTLPNEVVGSG